MKHSKRFRYFYIALLVLGGSAVAFIIWWQMSPMSAHDYMQKHNINTPADLTERHFAKLLPNIPKEYRTEITERLNTFAQEAGDDEWRTILWYATFWFKDYPPVYDPKNKTEYWQEAAQELCEYLEDRTELYRTKIDVPVEQGRWENEGRQYFFLYHLSDRQKENLRTGLPLYINPKLGVFEQRYIYGEASWYAFDNPAQAFMFERRNEELALLKVDATPNLVELNLTVGDIKRWDGSTSLQPVVRIIAAHAAGIPWKWRSPEGYHKRDGSEIVLTDHYHWAVDDEVGSEQTEGPESSYNRLYASRPSYDYSSLSSTLQPFAPESTPTPHFLNSFKFNQTHGAFVNVIEGNRDLAFATRRPSPDELQLAMANNVELECTPFARDAFVFIVNRHNPVRNLTMQQARDIFAGKITRWKDVGGVAGTMRPLIRDRNSGSEELMRELMMKNNVRVPADFKHQLISGMSGLFDVLERDTEGIGYTILYYDRFMVCNPHTRTLKIDGIEPTPQTIADGTYPLLYECVAVTRKGGPARAQAIVDWLISEEGQAVVRETGYCGR